MSSRFMIALSAVLVAACLGALAFIRSGSERQEPPPSGHAPVALAPVSVAVGPVSFVGVIVADGSVDVSSKFDGRLERLSVEVGDLVRKGQELARLDVQALRHELALAEAGLEGVRAEAEVAQLSLAEARETLARGGDPKLVSLGAISQEEQAKLRYGEQTALARLSVAQARVRTQQAQVELLRLRVAEAVIPAPFDGRVSMRYLDAGSLVTAGRPILHLLREGPQKVRFAIPEESVSRILVGMPVRIQVRPGSPPLEGRVENLAPEVDSVSRMVLAIASLGALVQERLPSGTVVRVQEESTPPVVADPQGP
ncbi:efflux RND transporter periplasmic adaptor subunit [Archangium gephyra]|nr:efflux RND transporter periplasmic adaptor subunit [Archangium gephyra]